MIGKYLITEFNNKKTGFLLEDGKLVKACLLSNESLVGNIYTAKVVNIVSSINSAFIDAGTGDFLYYSLADNDGQHIFLNTETQINFALVMRFLFRYPWILSKLRRV